MGHPLYATSVMGMTVVLNIVLTSCLLPFWGGALWGAGLATGIALRWEPVSNVPRLFSRHEVVAVQRGRYDRRLVWNAFYNGSSEGMSELSVAITVFLFNITMMRYLGERGWLHLRQSIIYCLSERPYSLAYRMGSFLLSGIITGQTTGTYQIYPEIGGADEFADRDRFVLLLLLFGEQVIGLF